MEDTKDPPGQEAEPATMMAIEHPGTKMPAFTVVATSKPATKEPAQDVNIRDLEEGNRCKQGSLDSKQTLSNSMITERTTSSPPAVVGGTESSSSELLCP